MACAMFEVGSERSKDSRECKTPWRLTLSLDLVLKAGGSQGGFKGMMLLIVLQK